MSTDERADAEADASAAGRFQVVPAAYVLLLRPGNGLAARADAGSPATGSIYLTADVYEHTADEVLLQLRRGTGYYDEHWASGAAGHVEAGESVFAAAAREAREELGIEIGEGALHPLTAMHRTHANGKAIDERVDFFFSCREWDGTPELQEAKAAELAWFPLDALPKPIVPHELYVLEKLRAGTLATTVAFGF